MKKLDWYRSKFLELIKGMSSEKIKEVMEYASFIKWQERRKKEKIVEFDAWARNLAVKKGFDRLTEKDVTDIVHNLRKSST